MKKLLITSIVAVVVIVAGWQWWVRQGESPAQTISPTRTVFSDNSTSPSPASGWKTYHSNKYKFEFKYPNSLTLEYVADINKFLLRQKDGSYFLTITAEDTNFGSVEAWFKDKFSDRDQNSLPKYNEISDPADGISYFDPISIGGCDKNYVFYKNSIVIDVNRAPATCKEEALFSQILSTFKFNK